MNRQVGKRIKIFWPSGISGRSGRVGTCPIATGQIESGQIESDRVG